MAEFHESMRFTMPLTVPTYDTGPSRCLRLSALLRWQQEIGEQHVLPFGLDWESLATQGIAFVLARGGGVIHRLPTSGERVTLETWSDRLQGVQFYRGYRLVDAAGECLTESMAAFALVDVNTHRLCRPPQGLFDVLPTGHRDTGCPDPAALKNLPPMTTVGEWTVRHSAVDFNRHLNNTVYADLMMDFLPADVRAGTPTAYTLHYQNEAREGDTLTMQYGTDGTAHYVRACVGETTCFAGRLTME